MVKRVWDGCSYKDVQFLHYNIINTFIVILPNPLYTIINTVMVMERELLMILDLLKYGGALEYRVWFC